jgi:Zn-dependent peptidase ImmA (M78 family)
MRKIPNKPRFYYCLKKAREFLIDQSITSLPVDPFEIAINNGWELIKITDAARETGISGKDILEKIIKSNDGLAQYCVYTRQYKITYNNMMRPTARIRWTIMHEIGHIVLGHLTEFETVSLTRGMNNKEYEVLETEAHFFASEVLAPCIVLKSINVFNAKDIKVICKLSSSAAVKKEALIKKHFVSDKIEIKLRDCFSDYVEKQRS